MAKDNNKMSDWEVNKEADDLATNLVNFENHLWKKYDDGIWTNTTEGAANVELKFAIRNQVKKHLPTSVALNDIDRVKKELQTILTGQKYSMSNITPAIRFADKKMVYDKASKTYRPSDDVDFSPFQLKRNLPKLDTTREQAKEFARYMDNLTGGDADKEKAIMEFCGYVLAGEHSGVSLVLEGESGIGKTTLAILLDAAIKAKREDKIMLNLQATDVYTTKGDNFAFANGVEKQLWVVGEGDNVFEEKAIKKFNDLIDESKATFPIRRMNQAPTNAPKFFNMLLLTNGGFKAFANAETMKAFKKRLVIVESPAQAPVLSPSEWEEMFSGHNINYFIQEAVRGYIRAKTSGKTRNGKFTKTTVENFWEEQDEAYVAPKMIKESQGFGDLWRAKQLTHITNDEIDGIIEEYQDNHRNFSKKYNRMAFKNEMLNAFESGVLTELSDVSKRRTIRIDGNTSKPLSFKWGKDE